MKAVRLVLLLGLIASACVEVPGRPGGVERYRKLEGERLTRLTDTFLQELASTENLVPMRRYFVSVSGFSIQEYFRRKFGHAFGIIRLASWKRGDFEVGFLPGLAVVNVSITVELMLKGNEEEERQVQFIWTRIRGRWYLMSK